jgi:S-adenosylmethionine-dependent methyltransferase
MMRRRRYLRPVASDFAGKAAWFDAHYASTRGRVRRALTLERVRKRLPRPPARLLDAGGGTGAFAVPLAGDGYDVTLLDASDEWLERARSNADRAGVPLRLILGRVEDAPALVEEAFDAILCHTVLLYAEDPRECLRGLRSVTREAGILSLLEKNRDGIALRPGIQGDYMEARRLLHGAVSAGRLGIENRARTVAEWHRMLAETRWRLVEWAGVRLFSDSAPDDLSDQDFDTLLLLERDAGVRDPYRLISRLVHIIAQA